ncbi:2-C-methyl-D-erythritol 4-phosphate cytidylyltransferase [Labilibacter sediminis]|nr:2-C-methyl-D-erythritol 4-phosphate cytidylyltransferase [Labilibacter sediminis]
MNKAVVIVAGGSGSRMKSEIPKQFIEWCSKPILMHTIEKFYAFDKNMNIVLVLPSEQFEPWHELCQKHQFSIPLSLTDGGNTRFESVKNGLSLIKEECLIGIHDGVRPLVSIQTLNNCFSMAQEKESAVPVTDSFESIRQIEDSKSKAVNRDNYKMVQTPQVFLFSKLKKAYNQPFDPLFTDDASVYEKAGYTINLCQGNRENIKITTPIDLAIGAALKQLDDENS